MTMDGGQRLATPDGAMLADPATLGNAQGGYPADTVGGAPSGEMFEPSFWARRRLLAQVAEGRGSAWYVGLELHPWVLRHYRRGGFIARICADRYLWTGENRVRSFVEWRLLEALARRALPVPTPIAARYRRQGMFYTCDLVTRRIRGAATLSATLKLGPLSAALWQNIGATIARFHAAGADHADLNAHNILVDGAGVVSLVDFDRGRLRAAGRWRARNVTRLHRSLLKISQAMTADRFSDTDWKAFLAGYSSEYSAGIP